MREFNSKMDEGLNKMKRTIEDELADVENHVNNKIEERLAEQVIKLL